MLWWYLYRILIKMEDIKTGIAGTLLGLLSAAVLYVINKRRHDAENRSTNAAAKLTEADSIDKLVETSNKLIDMYKSALSEEKNSHSDCRKLVEELQKRCYAMECRVEAIERKID